MIQKILTKNLPHFSSSLLSGQSGTPSQTHSFLMQWLSLHRKLLLHFSYDNGKKYQSDEIIFIFLYNFQIYLY